MTVKDFAKKYSENFNKLVNEISVTNKSGMHIELHVAMQTATAHLITAQKNGKKVMIIGNGGSAAIASHQAVDYWKNGGIKATAFNDSSLLTCISNDYSFEEVYSKPIEMFGEKNDLAFCISSSGQSKNILNAAAAAFKKECGVYTFSGFKEDNPLRKLGDLNFYVPSFSYGFVEILHLYIIHSLLDAKLYCNDNIDIFNKNLSL